MRRLKWHILLGIALVVVSAASYIMQICLFHRNQDTFFYMLQDFAFLPIQISLVTLVVNEVIQLREKNSIRNKMNMVIGAFFSDAGLALLRRFYNIDKHRVQMREIACIRAGWSDKDFSLARKRAAEHEYAMDCSTIDLEALKELLSGQRQPIMSLLANPSLLEHESFTDLLWAVSHLAEELDYRDDLNNLPDSDLAHLSGDIERAYLQLVSEWLLYARHLRDAYPYMFSLVVRANPFDPTASVVVGK